MKSLVIQLVAQLLTTDIAILISAKSLQVERKEDERTCWLTKWLLSKDKKRTKMHIWILVINIVIALVDVVVSFVDYSSNSKKDNLQAFADICAWIGGHITETLSFLLIIVALTIVFMILVYRCIGVIPMKDSYGENRCLSVKEIDKEYVNFSKPQSIDSHSALFLIAGDLSFLGDIPDIKSIKKESVRKECKKRLSNNSPHSACDKKSCTTHCSSCIEKSKQFIQLVQLQNKPISLNIICKKPEQYNDIAYKQRLGRLKKVFNARLQVRFLPETSLSDRVCVLGRIKVNAGFAELLWHWKDPDHQGYYTVPKIRREISSENRTLIYLLRETLWECAEEIDESMMEACVAEYEKALRGDV